MKGRVVFIHSSGWRTGSTYLWSKFRESEGVTAYYEPLNQTKHLLKEEDIALIHQHRPINHPEEMEPYNEEYRGFIRKEGGVRLYRPEFSYHRFFENRVEKNVDIERYLSSLIEGARTDSIPVLGFNRSVGRMPWLKRAFPSVNIYQYRNPRDQWVSIQHSRVQREVEQTIYYLNRNACVFNPLLRYREINFAEKAHLDYFLFFYFQVIFRKIGMRYADLVLDMNDLSSSAEKRKDMQDRIYEATGLDTDLSDMRIKEYPHPVRDSLCYPDIEQVVCDLTDGMDIELEGRSQS